MILVSACLLGENCKYSGGNNFNYKVRDFLTDKEYAVFCPECLGGLPVPRKPIELAANGQAINQDGEDKSDQMQKGAKESLLLCKKLAPELIILKEGSPSCGVHWIYDGSFCHQKIPGQGITAKLLTKNGYKVISEDDI